MERDNRRHARHDERFIASLCVPVRETQRLIELVVGIITLHCARTRTGFGFAVVAAPPGDTAYWTASGAKKLAYVSCLALKTLGQGVTHRANSNFTHPS